MHDMGALPPRLTCCKNHPQQAMALVWVQFCAQKKQARPVSYLVVQPLEQPHPVHSTPLRLDDLRLDVMTLQQKARWRWKTQGGMHRQGDGCVQCHSLEDFLPPHSAELTLGCRCRLTNSSATKQSPIANWHDWNSLSKVQQG